MNQQPARGNESADLRGAGLNRRRFLQGVGACVALPAFESLVPSALAAPAGSTAPLAVGSSGAPLRMAFVYFPNGAIPKAWWPAKEGKDFALSSTLEPLSPVKSKIQVLSGLDHINATAGPDGAGDHARAGGTFLTGVRVKKTAGADIHAGISIDQVAAQRIGHLTRFPSIELSCDTIRKSGNCDSGYSCAYQHNLAWRPATSPLAPEPNPRLVFERLFGAGAPGERRKNYELRQQQQRSIMDFVLDDARSLQKQLASRDRQKLDEYLSSIREIEKRIESAERFKNVPDPAVETPRGIPGSFAEHAQLMFDIMVLAFQSDSTRIATLILAGDGSNRTFPEIGIAEGHHFLTHHRNKKDMVEKVAQIDKWYVSQFARFLEKLDRTKDSDGKTLLDNSMIVYGSGNADGNNHTHNNLPLILAGGGGGTLRTGRYVKTKGVPTSNLFLSMVDRMGVKDLPRFGDSTGRFDAV